LSHLGIPTTEKDVNGGDILRAWIKHVQQRIQDLMIFNLVPIRFVSYEDILEKHAQ